MDQARSVPLVGAVASLALAVAVFAPYLVVTGVGPTLGAYYAAGPVGLAGVGFLALLAVVVFMAGRDGATAADTAAGITAVVGVAEFALTAAWVAGVDRTLLFSFPARYAWIQDHRWAVVGLTVVAGGAGLWYGYLAGTGSVPAGAGGVGGD